MKKFVLLALVAILFFACNQNSSSTQAQTENTEKNIDNEIQTDSTEKNINEEQSYNDNTNTEIASVQNEFCANFFDPDAENPTNLRATPGGKIVYKVPIDHRDYFTMTLIECKDGWFKIKGNLESVIPEIPDMILSGDCWIHNSVIAATLFGSIDEPVVREEPNENAKIITEMSDTYNIVVHFLDMKEDWVKISYTKENNEIIGWIPNEWICCNPLTNCL